MYNVLITIQYICILVLFIEGWLVFRNFSSRLHMYMFFSIVVNIINSAGYLFELKAKSGETYMTALKLSYFGRVWVAFSIALFVTELCRVKLHNAVKIGLALFHLTTFIVVLTTPSHELFYKDIEFVEYDGFIRMQRSSGIFHMLQSASIAFYIVYILTTLLVTLHKERNKRTRQCFITVLISMITQAVFTSVQIFVPTPITYVYDLTMPGFAVGTVIMLVAIFRFDLLGTAELAKEYIVDRISDGIVAADEDGNVAYFNKPAEKLYPGLARNAPDVVESIRTAIDRDEPIQISDRVYTPRTDTLYRGNDVSGTVYVLQDNTDLYKHTKELEEMTERANAANRAKSLFLSSMSHEIRTPINAVLGMDEMILRESAEKDTLSYAEDIQTAGRTLLSLINDILDFSKIEEGRMEILPAQYELSSLINDLVNMVSPRAEKKGLRFDVDVDRNIPHLLYGDEIRIKQCALNILTNAVKYTEKGSVLFSVSSETRGDGEILLTFRVKDTGIGMKPEDMEKLFSPFSRIEETRNRNIEGTGLGMSITRQLLDLMDSKLDVNSVYGEGSEFSFGVMQKVIKPEPIGDYAARYRSDDRRSVYREMFRAPDARILVVDDTPVNLAVIRGLLKRTQICVDTAESGEKALGMAAAAHYDLFFIDHMMPEMDGIETLHRLRRLPGYSDAVCIVLTANAVSGARETYINEGFDDYLTKPVDGGRLEKTIMERLPAEKIVAVTEEDDVQDSTAQLPERLYGIGEIDVDSGLKHCGSPEVYLETLSVYAGTALANADEIERLWQAGDIGGATIKIHALKSTSRAIGAEDLGSLAERLEAAGKAGDTETLDAGTGGLVERYRVLGNALSGLFRKEDDDDDKPLIPDDMLQKTYAAIREFSDNFDIDGAALAIESISKYRLPDSEKERFERIKAAADEFDWDAVAEIAGGV
ncbi:MAG: response regulator [Ruminiclostridium sp.]|nr:response regulator [Ruminiclostridium sp.]